MKVGFIGIGSMGGPMAANILSAGNDLQVYDANCSATDPLAKAGAVRCNDLASLVHGTEVVFLSLPGPPEVEAVATKILELMLAGQTLVDMSTNSPAVVKSIAARAQAKGVGFLDAPVSGGVRGAKKGTLSIMVGGEKILYDRLLSLFNSIGANIFHVGSVGSGNVAKLVNNSLAFSIMMASSEALVLGVKAGVDPNVLWNIVRTSSGNSMIWEGGGRAILQDRLAPAFTVDLACKDIGLATDLADEMGVDLTMIPTVEKLLKDFQADGFAKEDILATVKSLEAAADVTVRGTWDQ